MTQYRIVEDKNQFGETQFRVEWRAWYTLWIWGNLTRQICHYDGTAYEVRTFSSFEEAQRAIEDIFDSEEYNRKSVYTEVKVTPYVRPQSVIDSHDSLRNC